MNRLLVLGLASVSAGRTFHREARFHGGKDLRKKPYSLFRVKVDAGPVPVRR
jgi:hypothetical protein